MKLRDGDVMLAGDVATVLGVSTELVAWLRRRGDLPFLRTPSGFPVFLAKDVAALAEKRRKAPRGRKRGQVAVPPP